jgi:1,2-phenylacetyl-CoA epoxidase catalytic subunit
MTEREGACPSLHVPALERWADDEFLIGHHLGLLMHAHLDLEEAVAMGSLSQDELSHASLVLDMLGDDEAAKDRRLLLRDPECFACSSLAVMAGETWPDVVAKHLLYEEADALRVQALGEGTVIEREETLHRRHWWAWADALARRGAGAAALQASVDRLWPHCADLLDMAIPLDPARWAGALEEGLRGVGLRVPAALPAPRSRRWPTPETALCLQEVLAVAQSVCRSDPAAVWA